MNWINNRLMLGGEPFHEFHYQQLRAAGITHTVDMRLAEEVRPSEHEIAEEAGLIRLHFPLHDGNPIYYHKKPVTLDDLDKTKPSAFSESALMMAEAIEKILKVLVEFHQAKVYVHCATGVSRSPTIMCGVLVRMGWSMGAARAMVKKHRPGIDPAPWL